MDPEKIKDSFEVMPKSSGAFVAIVAGNRVKVRSGKSTWASKGAAKNAIINHLEYAIYWGDFPSQARKEYVQTWIQNYVQIMTETEWSKISTADT